jgi:hypothetical protein
MRLFRLHEKLAVLVDSLDRSINLLSSKTNKFSIEVFDGKTVNYFRK